MRKTWIYPPRDGADTARLADSLCISPAVADLLYRRGLTSAEAMDAYITAIKKGLLNIVYIPLASIRWICFNFDCNVSGNLRNIHQGRAYFSSKCPALFTDNSPIAKCPPVMIDAWRIRQLQFQRFQ